MEKKIWADRVRNVVLEKDGEENLGRSREKCGVGEGWRRKSGPIA